jgi:CSLREA domain-containing protein
MKTFVLPLAALCLLVMIGTTSAATRTVTNLNDGGPGSLRDAIAVSGSGDTINFAVTGTITLTSGSLSVNHNLSIIGPGAPWQLIITRQLGPPIFRIFYFDNGTWSLSNVTVDNGHDTVAGGGIYNGNGNLTLTNCVISGNQSDQKGGGVGNAATLSMNNCTFNNNYSASDGSGIYNLSTGTLKVATSTFSDNTTAGGGVIYTNGGGTVQNCTFTKNVGTSIIRHAGGTLTIQSCTFSGNGGSSQIFLSATIQLVSSSAVLRIGNTILDDDVAAFLLKSGAITSVGYNLSRDGGGGFLTTAGDQVNTDPRLDVFGLQYNGGYTDTIALSHGSPAIDAGKSFGLTTDQRGEARPFNNPNIVNAVGGDGSDIGAYEAPLDPVQFGSNLVVNSIYDHDDGMCGAADCTLREAISRANSGGASSPPAITFAQGLTGAITVQSELAITVPLTITGPGARSLAISGGGTTRIFNIDVPSSAVTISGLTIRDGKNAPSSDTSGQTHQGGAVFNYCETATFDDCAFVNNNVAGATNSSNGGSGGTGQGGAIFNAGGLYLAGCTFFGNSAIGAAGTAYSAGGTIGPGGNGGSGQGGAIFSTTDTVLQIENCTFSGNTATGGAGGAGSGTFNKAAGGDGTGAGIFSLAGTYGRMSIFATTISGNTGTGGLGYGSSFSHGPNGGSNGGVFVGATTQSNEVGDTIIAANRAINGYAAPDVEGPFLSDGYNLVGIGDQSSGFGSGTAVHDQVGTTAAPINPQVGPLQNNGGPTDTMALLPSSTAIDQGASFGLTTDQRGQRRPFNDPYVSNASDGSDIGAFELHLVVPATVVSQKTHGTAGNFKIKLPLSGNAGVECRKGGSSHVFQVIATFPTPITVGSAIVTPDPKVSGATVTLSNYVVSGSRVTVNLTGVSNAQTIRITLSHVSDGTSANDVSIPMGVLLGDTNNSRSVTSNDVSLTQSKVGQTTNGTNFREDVDLTGAINSTDVSLVQSKVGTALP